MNSGLMPAAGDAVVIDLYYRLPLALNGAPVAAGFGIGGLVRSGGIEGWWCLSEVRRIFAPDLGVRRPLRLTAPRARKRKKQAGQDAIVQRSVQFSVGDFSKCSMTMKGRGAFRASSFKPIC